MFHSIPGGLAAVANTNIEELLLPLLLYSKEVFELSADFLDEYKFVVCDGRATTQP